MASSSSQVESATRAAAVCIELAKKNSFTDEDFAAAEAKYKNKSMLRQDTLLHGNHLHCETKAEVNALVATYNGTLVVLVQTSYDELWTKVYLFVNKEHIPFQFATFGYWHEQDGKQDVHYNVLTYPAPPPSAPTPVPAIIEEEKVVETTTTPVVVVEEQQTLPPAPPTTPITPAAPAGAPTPAAPIKKPRKRIAPPTPVPAVAGVSESEEKKNKSE
jgi:hypothetical protein